MNTHETECDPIEFERPPGACFYVSFTSTRLQSLHSFPKSKTVESLKPFHLDVVLSQSRIFRYLISDGTSIITDYPMRFVVLCS